MGEWISGFPLVDKVFLGSAIVGGTLFLARMMMTLLGLGDDVDDGPGAEHDLDSSESSDLSFNFLSFQALMAFFMMFGLGGLAMSQGSKFQALPSLLVAVAAGVISLWVLRWLFSFFSRMQNSGTFDIRSAVGKRGRVYLTIPQDGVGKLELVVREHKRVMSAASLDGDPIPTDALAEVVEVRPGDMLLVRRILN